PPPSNETAYFAGETGGYQAPGGYQPSSNNGKGGNRGVLVGVGAAAAVLVLLLGVGGIWYAMSGSDEKKDPGAGGPTVAVTSQSAAPSPKGTGKPVKVSCEWGGAPKLRAQVVSQFKR